MYAAVLKKIDKKNKKSCLKLFKGDNILSGLQLSPPVDLFPDFNEGCGDENVGPGFNFNWN